VPSRASCFCRSHIKIAHWTHPTAGPGRGSLEDVFHLMVVIPIQTTDLLRFFRALQLSSDKAVLRTVPRPSHYRSTVVACCIDLPKGERKALGCDITVAVEEGTKCNDR
jgi:hypothetical protein